MQKLVAIAICSLLLFLSMSKAEIPGLFSPFQRGQPGWLWPVHGYCFVTGLESVVPRGWKHTCEARREGHYTGSGVTNGAGDTVDIQFDSDTRGSEAAGHPNVISVLSTPIGPNGAFHFSTGLSFRRSFIIMKTSAPNHVDTFVAISTPSGNAFCYKREGEWENELRVSGTVNFIRKDC